MNKQFCISGQDWSNVLEQWAGLIKLSARVGGIGQIFCESEGSVKLSALVGGIDQTFCSRRWD